MNNGFNNQNTGSGKQINSSGGLGNSAGESKRYIDRSVRRAQLANNNPKLPNKLPELSTDYEETYQNNYPERTIYPERTGLYPERTDIYPERTGTYPERTVLTPERTGLYPERTDIYPQRTDTYPERTSIYPERTDIYTDVYSESAVSYPERSDSYSESTRDYPNEPDNNSIIQTHIGSSSRESANGFAHTHSNEYVIKYPEDIYTLSGDFGNAYATNHPLESLTDPVTETPEIHLTEREYEQAKDYDFINEQAKGYRKAFVNKQTAKPQVEHSDTSDTYSKSLSTNRSFQKFFFLTIVTLGVYSIVFWSAISKDINIIAGTYDKKKTMPYSLLFFLLTPLTLGLAHIFWHHNLSGRIKQELMRRNIHYDIDFGVGTFWRWFILYSLIIIAPLIYMYFSSIGSMGLIYGLGSLVIIGPLNYTHKAIIAFNTLAKNYNLVG